MRLLYAEFRGQQGAGTVNLVCGSRPSVRAACRCQLTTQPEARRFRSGTRLNDFASTLFESVAAGADGKRLPRVRLRSLAYPCLHKHCPQLTAREATVRQHSPAMACRLRWTASTCSMRTCS